MLKVSPDPSLGVAEKAALDAWRGTGRVPRVLEFDVETGALLMEAIEPGTPLTDETGAARPEEISSLVSDLHAYPSAKTASGFPPLIRRVEFVFAFYRSRYQEWLRETGTAPQVSGSLMKSSLAAARDLAVASGNEVRQVLLHGDLHARNVLRSKDGRGLVAVDPRACFGDPAFDLIDWSFDGFEGESTLLRRSEALAPHAGVEPHRLQRWCACTAVLIALSRTLRGSEPTEDNRRLLDFAAEALRVR